MTVAASLLPSTVELDIAMARIDDALLHLCLLGDLVPSEDRHQIRNDLAAAVAAVVTHRRLHAAGGEEMRRVEKIGTRFWTKVNQTDSGGCWPWTAGLTHDGYGRFVIHGHDVLAHRWLYEQAVGPVPEGLQLDHICRNRACVNPAHLEPVTQQQNAQRGYWGSKTHCKHGHRYDEANIYWWRGIRHCRACREAMQRRRVRSRLRTGAR